ncbi:hypothetical protein HanXRQr2_Chr11g0490381 [Helianthus annuus]|uniref:Uncharacterized protein n=1 Tax=Helianthus annuus TaxID=4232 RepID=A0A9K3N026_HELAN|nr:hypothetical protein HanXRQr2_Chr11g0490381 [Helianthus annuus]KAJ0875129.1 hypothetical protein HanPSC8_Chr11g0472531 [Helianthus annuus]
MQDSNMSDTNFFTNEMNINLDVFRSLMLHRIVGQINGGDIIAIDDRRPS